MRLIVKGKLFLNGKLTEGSVLIEEGKITNITKEIPKKADMILDYSGKGKVVLPGLVDLHVHLRDFELSYKEDFLTGTAAAARGGFTVVGDMPNTIPKVNKLNILGEREKVAKNKALVDYALYFGVPEKEGDLKEGIQDLAIGFKIFMQNEFYTDERSQAEKMLEFASRKKMLVVAHAENPNFFVKTSMGEVGTPEAEASAIEDISSYSKNREFRLHITHLSSSAGFKKMAKWKKIIKLTSDTCPHYLLLTNDQERVSKANAKVNPRLKGGEDIKVLLNGLKDGKIDAVSSDHAPHSIEEKKDGEKAKSGFPGLETTLPLLLTMVNKGQLELGDIVRVCAINPSKIMGLNMAGEISPGKVGNLTIVDMHRRTRIDPSTFMSKAKYSPFEGREVEGGPVATVVRGQPVFLDGQIVAKEGWGKNVKNYG
jgi:dihydroorotase